MSRAGRHFQHSGLVALGWLLAGCAGGPGETGGPALYAALSDADVELAAAALQAGLETGANGAGREWRNPSSGNAGSITPQETLISADGQFCRQYAERLALADGRQATLHHTACRDADGHWIWLEG